MKNYIEYAQVALNSAMYILNHENENDFTSVEQLHEQLEEAKEYIEKAFAIAERVKRNF